MLSNKKYIAAVSAGPDSMYMLHKFSSNIAIVCHVNYHDREDTNNDERIIRDFCEQKKIPIFVLDVKENDYINISKKNLQSKYRQIRFDFFEKIANEHNIKNIMIGHNIDDNIETMYMQLLKEKEPLFYGLKKHGFYNELNIFRPLLNKWKNNIYLMCIKHKIDFAFDYSNENLKFYRNYIRSILENIDIRDKQLFINVVNKYNDGNKNRNKQIQSIYNEWELQDFNTSYYINIKSTYRNNILYMYLTKFNIKKINGNKLKELNNFILLGKVNGLYRVDLNTAIFKTKSNIKISYNNS